MKIKFFITPVYPYGNDHYYHEIISLAEGFAELGYTVFGNTDYWWIPEENTYLIKGDNNNEDFDIAIYDYRYVTSFAHLLFRDGYPNFQKGKKHILIDRNDWIKPIWWNNKHYNIFDHIFAGNLYNNIKYPENVKPWAIGLTNRIIKCINKFYDPNTKRELVTGYNFRIDHNMRGYVLNKLLANLKTYPAKEKFTSDNFSEESDKFYNMASTKRHSPEYYKTLCNTLCFMSFGGYYEFKPLKYHPYDTLDKFLRKPYYWRYKRLKNSGKDFSSEVFIFQQDNFRFWEVLYSGSIAVNLDLAFWNFKLPVMPVPNEHYIAIKSLSAESVEKDLSKLSEQNIKTISINARQWVLNNYSPKAQALRVLDQLNKKN